MLWPLTLSFTLILLLFFSLSCVLKKKKPSNKFFMLMRFICGCMSICTFIFNLTHFKKKKKKKALFKSNNYIYFLSYFFFFVFLFLNNTHENFDSENGKKFISGFQFLCVFFHFYLTRRESFHWMLFICSTVYWIKLRKHWVRYRIPNRLWMCFATDGSRFVHACNNISVFAEHLKR